MTQTEGVPRPDDVAWCGWGTPRSVFARPPDPRQNYEFKVSIYTKDQIDAFCRKYSIFNRVPFPKGIFSKKRLRSSEEYVKDFSIIRHDSRYHLFHIDGRRGEMHRNRQRNLLRPREHGQFPSLDSPSNAPRGGATDHGKTNMSGHPMFMNGTAILHVLHGRWPKVLREPSPMRHSEDLETWTKWEGGDQGGGRTGSFS